MPKKAVLFTQKVYHITKKIPLLLKSPVIEWLNQMELLAALMVKLQEKKSKEK